MFSHTRDIILAAEQAVSTREADEGLRHLRHLSLDDFGQVLFGLPDDSLPNLSAVFPRMPGDDVQKSSTGHSGLPLLQADNQLRAVGSVQLPETSGSWHGRSNDPGFRLRLWSHPSADVLLFFAGTDLGP